jgi:nitrate reductase delta subunit
MRHTLLILSHVLRYPTQELQQAAPELLAMLELDGVLEGGQIEKLNPLVEALIEEELLDLQERYVGLFDRGRAVSLHLFEHVHGESRDRGQAMVDLRNRYEAQGLEITANELPDYLPMFLEYLLPSLATDTRGTCQPGIILHALAERLVERDTPYAGAMQVLAGLAGAGARVLPSRLRTTPMIWPRWTPHGPRNRSVSIRLPLRTPGSLPKNGGHARPPAANRCAEEPDPWLISSITCSSASIPMSR